MVVYVLCFDMKESRQNQLDQIVYWLNYLNSTLSLPSHSTHAADPKWCIMLVGLRSDLQRDTPIPAKHIAGWQQKYPRLVIANHLFSVSALMSTESIEQFCTSLEGECSSILDKHSARIPLSYKSVLQSCENHSNSQPLTEWKTLMQEQQEPSIDPPTFFSALQYLHAIGRIVLLKNGLVCTNPTVVPQVAAKFISPEEVQLELLKKETDNVQILDKQEVGCLLQIDTSDNTRLYLSFFYFLY